jgi:hypothetical protein
MNFLELLAWVTGLLGFGSLVFGVAQLSVPAAFIVAGALLMSWSYLADKASAASSGAPRNSGGG